MTSGEAHVQSMAQAQAFVPAVEAPPGRNDTMDEDPAEEVEPAEEEQTEEADTEDAEPVHKSKISRMVQQLQPTGGVDMFKDKLARKKVKVKAGKSLRAQPNNSQGAGVCQKIVPPAEHSHTRTLTSHTLASRLSDDDEAVDKKKRPRGRPLKISESKGAPEIVPPAEHEHTHTLTRSTHTHTHTHTLTLSTHTHAHTRTHTHACLSLSDDTGSSLSPDLQVDEAGDANACERGVRNALRKAMLQKMAAPRSDEYVELAENRGGCAPATRPRGRPPNGAEYVHTLSECEN